MPWGCVEVLCLKSKPRWKNWNTAEMQSTNVNREVWRLLSKIMGRCSIFNFQVTQDWWSNIESLPVTWAITTHLTHLSLNSFSWISNVLTWNLHYQCIKQDYDAKWVDYDYKPTEIQTSVSHLVLSICMSFSKFLFVLAVLCQFWLALTAFISIMSSRQWFFIRTYSNKLNISLHWTTGRQS